MVMSAATPVDIGSLIVSRPGVNGGRPCLAGTGMSVHAVVARHLGGMSAQDILDDIPDLDLARIHAALAYYFANKGRIDGELEAEQRLYAELAARHPRRTTPAADSR